MTQHGSFLLLTLLFGMLMCSSTPHSCNSNPPSDRPQERALDARRLAMVKDQIEDRGIADTAVLAAMRRVERHEFVPPGFVDAAYADQPLPIGWDQTISQPYIVALMTELLSLERSHRVLEIGTGSGYQAAVLAEIVDSVWSIEILEPLAISAQERLGKLGYRVNVRWGDGYLGWPEHAPFDRILVTAAAEDIPQPLLDQLGEGGKMVIPVGPAFSIQNLYVIEKRAGKIVKHSNAAVRFVPLTRDPKK